MKKYLFIAVVAMVSFVGCEKSTFLGEDNYIKPNERPNPGDQITVFEDVEYKLHLDTDVNLLYTVEQIVKGNQVTYEGQKEISSKPFEQKLDLNVAFTATPSMVYVAEEAQLQEVSLLDQASYAGEIESEKTGDFVLTTEKADYTFTFDQNEVVSAAAMWQKLSTANTEFAYAKVKNVSYTEYDAVLDEANSNADSIVYNINLYFNVEVVCAKEPVNNENFTVRVPMVRVYKNGERPDNWETKLENEVYEAEFDVRTKELFTVRQQVSADVVTYKNGEENARESYSYPINLAALFNVNEVVYVDTKEQLAQVSMNGSSHDGDRVDAREDGAFKTTTRSLNYNFRFNEGEVVKSATEFESLNYGEQALDYTSIQNVSYTEYEANLDEAKSNADSTVYNVTLYFDVEVRREKPSLPEAAQTRADAETEVYTVAVPYLRVNMHKEEPKPEEPIDKVIPEAWGNIIGAGISAVPSDDVSGNFAKKCLTIRTDKGAVAVVFNYNDAAPAVANVLGSYFVEGNFSAEYNSGYYTTAANKANYQQNKWAPAIAKDLSDRIAYYRDNTCVRNVRNTTLTMWDWRNGNLSTVVDGYTFNVDNNGVLTIAYNGREIMQLR